MSQLTDEIRLRKRMHSLLLQGTLFLVGMNVPFFLYGYDIPEVKDYSYWNINELNPKTLREGQFYYGIMVEGQLFISTMREREAEVGKRAGGHFKLVRGWLMRDAIESGRTMEQAEAIAREAFKKQAEQKEKYHGAIGFGFKAVRNERGELVIKWHGFNSFKSTIHSTSTESGINRKRLILAISEKYRAGNELAHPITDADLKLNPKYLDKSYENYRGVRELWRHAEFLAPELMEANEAIGFSNKRTLAVLAQIPARFMCSAVYWKVKNKMFR